MLRVQMRMLRHRAARAGALFVAVLIAATGFTVLTASSRASELGVVGTVKSQARLDYDILVRPKGTRTTVEKDQGLIQGGYLSGIYGGISMKQWHRIQQIPGISVAAPIAMLGYVIPLVLVPVNLDGVRHGGPDSVTRLDVTWRSDNGLSVERAAPDFAFVTDKALSLEGVGDYLYHYGSPSGPQIDPRSDFFLKPGYTEATRPPVMTYCSFSTAPDSVCVKQGSGQMATTIEFPFPTLLAAVDPASEAKLTGLGTHLASGHGLVGTSLSSKYTLSGKVTPVLAGAAPATQLQAQIRLSQVGGDAAAKVRRGAGARVMATLPHTPLGTATVNATTAYAQLLTQLRHLPKHGGDPSQSRVDVASLSQRFAIGTPTYLSSRGVLVPRVVANNIAKTVTYYGFTGTAPAGMDDTAVRKAQSIQGPQENGVATPASVQVVGTLPKDAARKLSDVTSQILSGLTADAPSGADARSRRLLGDKPLAPSPDVAGLVQPPPLMITTLAATGQWYDGWQSEQPISAASAPISAIRVRVANVHGIDQTSRERVRLAAQRIQQQTGLAVDITLGASLTHRTVVDPAGTHGRPRLSLAQNWVKKGVATTILNAVDKKSVAIFFLVLLVCALTVANSAIASVRARRTEFGVLACLGWTRRQIATLVLTQIGLLAGLAGLLSIGLSLLIGRLVGTPVGLGRASLALPAGLIVALLAGLVPIWRASQSAPMAALQAPIAAPRRSTSVRSIAKLAWVNLTRNKARTLLGAGGLSIAVAAATFLVVIALGFSGAVVGSVLGNAVAIEVRTADYAAVGATLLLGLLGVANVVYLNIRERGVEFATLLSTGWSPGELNRSVVYEALGLGALGTLAGIILGLAGAAVLLTGAPATAMILAALLCAGIGTLITLLAATSAGQLLRRLPITALLTEE